jgi:hypothetical protein
LNRYLASIGIFVAAAITLTVYLLGLRFHLEFPVPFFFISLGLIAATLIYQCLALELFHPFPTIIISEIVVANILLHLIYQISGYGLYGSDSYTDFCTLKGILYSGFVGGSPEYIQITDSFPMIHIWTAELVLINKLNMLDAAKWFPMIIDCAMIPFLYLLARHLFKQEKTALLSTLLFISLQHHILYSSLFIRETFALVMAVACVYFYMSARASGHPIIYRLLSVMFLVGTICAHHLTSLMLIIMLFVLFIVSYFTKVSVFKRIFRGAVEGEKSTLSFVVIAVVVTMVYWTVVAVYPIRDFSGFLKDLISVSNWGQHTYVEMTGISNGALPSIRYYFLIYGSYLCFLIFGLLLLFRLLSRNKPFHIETWSFSLYLFLCAVFGIAFTLLLPRTVIGDRFLMYGWLLVCGPLALTIFELRSKLVKGTLFLVLSIFIFINVFTIHPALWNSQKLIARPTPSQEDYALAKTINFTNANILSTSNDIFAIVDVRNFKGENAFTVVRPRNISEFQWIIVNRLEMINTAELTSKFTLNIISAMQRLRIANSILTNKTYESNNIEMFERR